MSKKLTADEKKRELERRAGRSLPWVVACPGGCGRLTNGAACCHCNPPR